MKAKNIKSLSQFLTGNMLLGPDLHTGQQSNVHRCCFHYAQVGFHVHENYTDSENKAYLSHNKISICLLTPC